MLTNSGRDERLGHLAAALDVHPENVVGDEDVRRFDLLQLRDDAVRRFLAERRLVKFPDRAEVAAERAAARRFEKRKRTPEIDIVLAGVLANQVARRERQ